MRFLCKKCNSILLDTTLDAVTRFEHILSCTDEANDSEPIAALDEEISINVEQQRQLQILRRKKISLRSAFCRIPSELSADIFSRYLQDDTEGEDHRRTPLFLGKICAAWRDVVWSTPRLWSSVNIVLSDVKRFSTQAELLRGWLLRSGGCQLSLKISTLEEDFWDTRGPPSKIIDVMIAHSTRWHSIDLFLPFRYLQRIPPIDLPCLTSAVIKCVGQSVNLTTTISNPIGAFLMAPRLHTISLLRPVSPFMMDLPWNQLTTFHGDTFFLGEFFEVLQKACNVNHCTFKNVLLNEEIYTAPTAQICHERLHSLVLQCNTGTNSEPLRMALDYLILPNLRDFEITGPEYLFPANEFIGMLARSSNSLQRFSAKGMVFIDTELVLCLRAMSSVVEFHADYVFVHVEMIPHQEVADTLVLPHLTNLMLSYENPSGIDYVLNSISVPALRQLEIKASGALFPHLQFRDMIFRSGCSLHKLTLNGILINKMKLLHCLMSVPSLLELTLAGIFYRDESASDSSELPTIDLLSILCCRPDQEVCILPNLCVFVYLVAPPYDVEVLCDMLESRWRTPAEGGKRRDDVAPLHLAIIHSNLYLDTHGDGIQPRLRLLQDQGMMLYLRSKDAS